MHALVQSAAAVIRVKRGGGPPVFGSVLNAELDGEEARDDFDLDDDDDDDLDDLDDEELEEEALDDDARDLHDA